MVKGEAFVAAVLQKVVVSRSTYHRNVRISNLIHQRLTSDRLHETLETLRHKSCQF